MNEVTVFHIALRVVAASSVAHIFLPPYDVFNDFPRFQKYYKLLVAVVGYLALNARGKVIQAYASVQQAKAPVDTPPQP